MKKIFTSFAFMCLFALATMAQGNFTLSGIVVNGLGTTVNNHQVCIYTDSSQTSLAYYNCVNTNNQGYFSVVIPGGSVIGPNIIFYVTTQSCSTYVTQQVSNNQGTTSSATISLSICNNFVASCTTSLYGIPDSTGIPSNFFFVGYSFQNGSVATTTSYSWSFGDGSANSTQASPQHTYVAPGTYTVCLTTTTSTGCTSNACTSVTVAGGNSCTANFGYQSTGAGNNTYFNALFGANYNYSWIFGDGSQGTGQYPIHTYTNAGQYTVCLLVYDAVAACSDTICKTVYVQAPQTSFYVYGQVSLPGLGFLTPADYGTVYLIRHDSIYLNAIDTTTIDSAGYYFFSNVAPGTYLVKAALNSNSAYYGAYLPTYHSSNLFWTGATGVVVVNSSIGTANINMIAGNNPGGPGFIGGSVLQGANRMAAPGDPIVGITILLLDMSNNPITSTTTDANGNYSFPNIAYGTYKVYAEVAGKTTVPSIVTIDAVNPAVSNVNVEVNSGNILVVKTIASEEATFGLYPNPASDYLSVSVELKDATLVRVTIENNVGQVVQRNAYQLNAGKHNITESLTALPKGVYSISVTDNTSRTSSKFVKAE